MSKILLLYKKFKISLKLNICMVFSFASCQKLNKIKTSSFHSRIAKALFFLALKLISKVFFRHILVEAKIKFLLLLTTFLSYWSFSSLFIARWAWEKQQAVLLSRTRKVTRTFTTAEKRREIYDFLVIYGRIIKNLLENVFFFYTFFRSSEPQTAYTIKEVFSL